MQLGQVLRIGQLCDIFEEHDFRRFPGAVILVILFIQLRTGWYFRLMEIILTKRRERLNICHRRTRCSAERGIVILKLEISVSEFFSCKTCQISRATLNARVTQHVVFDKRSQNDPCVRCIIQLSCSEDMNKFSSWKTKHLLLHIELAFQNMLICFSKTNLYELSYHIKKMLQI